MKSLLLVLCLVAFICQLVSCEDDELKVVDELLETEQQQDQSVELEDEVKPEDESGKQVESDKQAEPDAEHWSEKNEFRLTALLAGRYFEKKYVEINERLVKELTSNEPKKNLDFLFKWLEFETKGGKKPDGSLMNRNLVLALKQLSSISLVLEDTDRACSRDAWAALYKNNRATRGHAHMNQHQLKPLTRVESIVHQLSMVHAIKCLPRYPERYQLAVGKLDKVLYKRVEAYQAIAVEGRHLASGGLANKVTELIQRHLRRPDTEAHKLASIREPAKETEAALAALHVLVGASPGADYAALSLVVDERTAKTKVDEARLGKLVEEFLLEPCAHYVRLIGQEVVQPLKYDLRMLDNEDRELLRRTLAPEADFNLGMARYVHCARLQRSATGKLVGQLASLIRRQSKER